MLGQCETEGCCPALTLQVQSALLSIGQASAKVVWTQQKCEAAGAGPEEGNQNGEALKKTSCKERKVVVSNLTQKNG